MCERFTLRYVFLVSVWNRTSLCVCVHMRVYGWVFMSVHMCTCVCVCVCVCVCFGSVFMCSVYESGMCVCGAERIYCIFH